MAGPISSTAAPVAAHDPGTRYGPALTLLASLFFMWGFITVINNTLLPHLRSVFELSYTQTTLIESVWFIAYFVASIPSAKLIERIGYQRSLVTRSEEHTSDLQSLMRTSYAVFCMKKKHLNFYAVHFMRKHTIGIVDPNLGGRVHTHRH